jgi:triacylglycerol lipase
MADAIHGITFVDYCATNAFLVQGKQLADLLPVLGIESPQWDEACKHFERAMANDHEFVLVTQLGEVYQNPAQGKYAGAATQTSNDAVLKITSMEQFIDVQNLFSAASQFGIDPTSALTERGLTLMDYSQAGMHYMAEMNSAHTSNPDLLRKIGAWHEQYREVHEARFEAEAGGRIGDDIEF